MTSHPVTILEDGTRVYSNRTRYTPMPAEARKNSVRKPDDPRAFRWKGDWLLPLDLVAEEQRVLPETIPDTVAFDHAYRRYCRCPACRRPTARAWRKKWRRQMRKDPSASA